MLYNTCPTCGFFMGNLTKKFEEEKEKICSSSINQEEINKKVSKLIMELPLRRYCCRMRFMTYKDVVKDLVAPERDTEE